MQPTREHAFARSGFAENQHRTFGGENLSRLIRERADRGAGADKRIDRLTHLPRLAGQLFVVVALFLQQTLKNDEQRRELERLSQETVRRLL